MKLVRLKLLERYRSLEPFEQSFPKPKFIVDEIDPICLVGLNGSGKSNFLELLGDIFYFLDVFFLSYHVTPKPYTPYADNKKRLQIFFEIEYKINVEGQDEYVKIERFKESRTIKTVFSKFENGNFKVVDDDFFQQFLPRVIAYTSGSNELLSMPFIELQDYYAREVTYRVNMKKKSPSIDEDEISQPNLTLMDFDSNAAILISNFLLNEEKAKTVFEDTTRIKGLDSFRIVIRLDKGYSTNKIDLPSEFETYIDKLKKCATCYNLLTPDKKRGDVYYFDYLVNNATRLKFKNEFENSQNLFTALYKLNLLNTFSVQKEYRNTLRKKRENGILLKFPTIATLDKIFSIEQVELVLKKPTVRTEYMKISDGEHQFIHVVGAMLLFDVPGSKEIIYLFDEPDTHFNPQWRSKFFSQLNSLIQCRNHELLLTTHSPFILSDCHGYNVFKFTREKNGEKVYFSRIEDETYGASFSNILKNAFEFENLVSEKSLTDLESLVNATESVYKQKINLFGDSVEKLYVIKEIEEQKNKK
ncbi:hypothetical protein DHW03_00930 [Pedobacter yonginense]|uniref:ATPase AAA-type core domain-containing protein n=1 Tax=Pedobacter yonginense TaxID=651869 RepID=A0A317EPB1_9SPHI|nr:restriction system-associated AAA family ATPase [Pedobacter yonginense]PWS28454.1 hypothetical protein DHW03_00930 [Pedobacter yonginense]